MAFWEFIHVRREKRKVDYGLDFISRRLLWQKRRRGLFPPFETCCGFYDSYAIYTVRITLVVYELQVLELLSSYPKGAQIFKEQTFPLPCRSLAHPLDAL